MNSEDRRQDLQIKISRLEEEISSIEAVIADLDLQIEYAKIEAEKQIISMKEIDIIRN